MTEEKTEIKAFDSKRKEYENKVQKYNNERQSKLMRIDELIALSRNEILNAIKPILEEISNEKGITTLHFILNLKNINLLKFEPSCMTA